MEMQGNRVIAATQQQTWEALLDPQVLQACIPGCEKMEATGPNQYAAAVGVKIGPVSARFNAKVALSDVDPPQGCTISFDGQGGAAGHGRGSAKVRLAPLVAGCELSYDVNAQVGGKIAQVGQRLIDGVSKAMAEDFFKRFDDEMRKRHPGEASPKAAVVESRAAMPPWVWIAGAIIVAAIMWLLLRS
ncbi:MAG TPA: carbon monoxide dehydrogenase subunit G [Ramlibacter sp.]|nr:carbon monoxide dehydrogenase subunit G [Ramlibacter sp.]